eukprot:151635-Prymnesium_polylepis.1
MDSSDAPKIATSATMHEQLSQKLDDLPCCLRVTFPLPALAVGTTWARGGVGFMSCNTLSAESLDFPPASCSATSEVIDANEPVVTEFI